MRGRVRVGLIQMACGRDPAVNLEKALWRVREAAGRGAQVICLPELFRTEYFPRRYDESAFALAEPVEGPTVVRLAELARELRVVIIVPLFERRAAGLYHNSAVVIDAGGEVRGVYRKMHLPDDPLFFEKYYFAPGDTGFACFETRYARLGVLICWDQWFPEAARAVALRGAEILIIPTAIGWLAAEKPAEGERQVAAWKTIQMAHAVANGIYVATVNRVGLEGSGEEGTEFWGHSFVAGPFGELLAEAPEGKETTLVVECDLVQIEQVRQGWPFLRDRRIDAYDVLLKRWVD